MFAEHLAKHWVPHRCSIDGGEEVGVCVGVGEGRRFLSLVLALFGGPGCWETRVLSPSQTCTLGAPLPP